MTESWTPQPIDHYVGSPVQPKLRRDVRLFWIKAVILLVTTLALIPVLIAQSALGGAIYVGFLVAVHVIGLVVFAYGLRGSHFGTSLRGIAIRVGGLLVLTALLYMASKGLTSGFSSVVFWVSLTAIWALHTAGAAMLHLMPERRQANSLCPFF